ncbi:hypothetical protein ABKV19_009342 [Rosa sericea]
MINFQISLLFCLGFLSSIQRSVCIILLPLFLCTLFGIISVSYSYSDIQDSVLSTSLAVLGSNINFSAIIGENNKKGAYLLTFATAHPTQLATNGRDEFCRQWKSRFIYKHETQTNNQDLSISSL